MKKVEVYYCGWGEDWKLGELADDGRDILFEYSPEAIRRGIEFSPLNLKLSTHTYRGFPASQMGLPGFIADSLPDGWGLFLMDKVFRKQGFNLQTISPLDRLSFLGKNAMGALRFKPSVDSDFDSSALSILEIAQEVQKIDANEPTQALRQLAFMGGSPQGARPKVLVEYKPGPRGPREQRSGGRGFDHAPLSGVEVPGSEGRSFPRLKGKRLKKVSKNAMAIEGPWLIKFPAAGEHKEVCAIEALYAELAREAGLNIPETRHFDLGKNLAAFGTQRFDRLQQLRVFTHTLAGALHADFRIPSSVDYLTYLKLVRFMTKDEQEILSAFRQCVFNVVFNNRDDHPKNFSFILNRKLEWRLAPSYDLTFSAGPRGEHHMDICGEGKSPARAHLLLLASKSGLNLKVCEEILNQVLTAAAQFKVESKHWEIRTSTLKKIDAILKGNMQRIKF